MPDIRNIAYGFWHRFTTGGAVAVLRGIVRLKSILSRSPRISAVKFETALIDGTKMRRSHLDDVNMEI